MELKNTGKPIELTEDILKGLTNKEIEQITTEFSEGNKGLKELLKYCMENKILTLGSCGGHKDRARNVPYIAFKMNEQNRKIFSKIFSNLMEGDFRLGVSKELENRLLIINVNEEHPAEDFFNIKDLMEHSKELLENSFFNKIFEVVQETPNFSQAIITSNKWMERNGENTFLEFAGSQNIYVRNGLKSTFSKSESKESVEEGLENLLSFVRGLKDKADVDKYSEDVNGKDN